MTNKINMVINLSILGLLIYLSVAIKEIQEKVFPDPNVMIPLGQLSYDGELANDTDKIGWMIKNLLIEKLQEAK